MKKLIYLFVLCLIVFSCELKDIDFEGMDNYKIEEFKNNEATIHLDFHVKNDNRFGIKVKPSSLKVSADGKELGELFLDKKIKIKGKRSNAISSKVRFKMADGAMLKMMGLASKKEVTLRFEGKVKGGVFIFSKKIKIDESKTIDPKQLNPNQLNK